MYDILHSSFSFTRGCWGVHTSEMGHLLLQLDQFSFSQPPLQYPTVAEVELITTSLSLLKNSAEQGYLRNFPKDPGKYSC